MIIPKKKYLIIPTDDKKTMCGKIQHTSVIKRQLQRNTQKMC